MDASGYAHLTRSVALWLRRLGARVRVEPMPWGAARIDLPPDEQAALREMLRERDGRGPVLYISVANAFKKHSDRPSIGWTMLETDGISPLWVRLCNSMDEVWVPSEFNRDTFTVGGVDPARLQVMPLGIDPARFHPGVRPLAIPGRRGFNFLANMEWIPRKGYDILLRAYLEEFRGDEDVSLTIKAYNNSNYDPEGGRIRGEIVRIGAAVGGRNPPSVILLSRVMPPGQLPALYRAADCYILPTRGEGWNFPAMEAAACGVPVITTAWSGHLAFLNEANSYLIPIERLEPVPAQGTPNDAVYAGSRWAVPGLAETRRLMRHVFTHRQEAAAKARRARRGILEGFNWERIARLVLERLSRW